MEREEEDQRGLDEPGVIKLSEGARVSKIERRTFQDVGDLGRVGVAGEGEAVGLEEELGPTNLGLCEHGEVGARPCMVGATISSIHLLRLLWGEIDLHWRLIKSNAAEESRGAVDRKIKAEESGRCVSEKKGKKD